MNIGIRIKARREQLNMSQAQLAQKLNYRSRSSINKIELGRNDITQSKVIAFAKALKTTPAYLMGWEEGANDISYANMVNVPIYSNAADQLQVNESDLKLQLPNILFSEDTDYFYLYMSDESMVTADIHKNDLLIFKNSDKLKNGDIGLFAIKDRLLIRKFYVDKIKKTITLIAADDHTTPLSFATCDEFKILGILDYVLVKK